MNIDFPPPSKGTYNNAGGCRQLANYLEHEDMGRMEKGIYTEGFFNLIDDNLYKAQVIEDIDKNIGQLLKPMPNSTLSTSTLPKRNCYRWETPNRNKPKP